MNADSGQPWLSVLVPVYNVAPYLRDCVESVMAQADPDVEVLLLDDCSTDGSDRIALQLQAVWPQQLQVLRHVRNQGLSAARNTLLSAARGRYLWFLDSDDFLTAGAIPRLRACVQRDPVDMVLCDFTVWRQRPQLKHRLRGEAHRRSFRGQANIPVHDRARLLEGLMQTGQMHAWSKIATRALWRSTGLTFPVGAYFEDMATMPCLALNARSFLYVPEPWVAYRQRSGSILSTITADKAEDLAQALLPFARAYLSHAMEDVRLQQPSLQFAIAHQATRNYIGAMRGFAALPVEERNRHAQLPATFAAHYHEACPLEPEMVLQWYWRKGWLLRYFRARRWLAALRQGAGA